MVPLKSTCLASLTLHLLLPGHKHLPSSGEFYSHFLKIFRLFILYWGIADNNAMTVSGEQQRDSTIHIHVSAAAAAKSLQSCPTLCDPNRRQPTRLPRPWDSPGKNTGVGCHFLLQCMRVKVKSLSRVPPSATPWTAAYQAPPSMGFSRQEYWSGVPLPSPPLSSRRKQTTSVRCSSFSIQN